MIDLASGSNGILALLVLAGMVVLGHPLYIIVVALTLRACGNSKAAVAKWALRQADRNRMIEVVRAIRGRDRDGEPP